MYTIIILLLLFVVSCTGSIYLYETHLDRFRIVYGSKYEFERDHYDIITVDYVNPRIGFTYTRYKIP